MAAASAAMRYEEASALHDLLHTVEEMGEKQKMAAAEGSDTDILAYYAEPPLLAAAYWLWGERAGWPLRLAGAAYALLACALAYRFAGEFQRTETIRRWTRRWLR